ncbi:PfkB family carbohydrate kinase [Microbacterium sp. C7(2022)]|uniref:PfkB family carbohydrate kinase n=1 Tax=Microbacterium sp. C7(2022) TaxID=2992759 RepID=UPI00237ABDA6|nr:PfkB family carbohydrate kinase [Microbacterium sp. C7(2022)]MDE0546127.1 PfkB family carbohydrate kinase [Microbacterium sp. C7(2022)]
MSRVVVVGDALIDEIRDHKGVREFVGGAALNVAVGLQRLGVPAALVAMVGDDEAGEHIRTYVADHGVELIATEAPHGSARAVSTRNADGEPEYEFNEASQKRHIGFDSAAVTDALAEAPLVAVSCMALDDLDQVRALADAVEYVGAPFAIDPNPRTGMMRDLGLFVTGFERLAARAALVKVGADDSHLLYGTPVDALRARLIEQGARAVLATEGADGASIEAGGVVVTAPISTMPGPIIDTMGAGDAVFASMLSALVRGVPRDPDQWRAALHDAMDAAAATCRFEGALLRLPTAIHGDDFDRIGT